MMRTKQAYRQGPPSRAKSLKSDAKIAATQTKLPTLNGSLRKGTIEGIFAKMDQPTVIIENGRKAARGPRPTAAHGRPRACSGSHAPRLFDNSQYGVAKASARRHTLPSLAKLQTQHTNLRPGTAPTQSIKL